MNCKKCKHCIQVKRYDRDVICSCHHLIQNQDNKQIILREPEYCRFYEKSNPLEAWLIYYEVMREARDKYIKENEE